MKTIREWQSAAYELAVEKGWHSRPCRVCGGSASGVDQDGAYVNCPVCLGERIEPVDPHSPTRIASRLALIHCEISAAVECVARGKMDLYWVLPDNYSEVTLDGMKYANDERELVPMTVAEAQRRAWKPEGFPIELADVFLRLCDLAESLGHEIKTRDVSGSIGKCDSPEGLAAGLFQLHQHLSDVYAFTYIGAPSQWDGQQELNTFASLLFGLASATGVDLLAMAELKHEYERVRVKR